MKIINEEAPVTCRETITIEAPREKVWDILSNIDEWPTWEPEISKTKLNGELQPGTTFTWKTGGSKIKSTLHTVEPYSHFGWTGNVFGISAIHNWALTESKGITKVEVAESMEGFLAGVFKKSLQKTLDNNMHNWLGFLKTACEK